MQPTAEAHSVARSPRRLLLAFAGLICVGLALIGVVLPGMPTTVFLIAASYFFTRSCPWLEQRVFGWKVFRPFIPYVRGDRPMPMRARITTLLVMWAAVTTSLALLAAGDRLGFWLGATIICAALIGSFCILLFRRTPRTVKARASIL